MFIRTMTKNQPIPHANVWFVGKLKTIGHIWKIQEEILHNIHKRTYRLDERDLQLTKQNLI